LEEIVLDIHLPHGKPHGIKDFFIHLFTITVGLFIALSLEGLVEHRHHQHLAREAEDGLRAEIANNAKEIAHQREQIKDHLKQLQEDQNILAAWRANPHTKMGRISLGSEFESFDDMSWKNAQNTGALAYMPYKDAQSFSDIYLEQDSLSNDARQVADEIINSASLFVSHPDHWVPSPAQIDIESDRIGRAQVRLYVLSQGVDALDKAYQKFESEHK
jgi:hypothetical protein